MVLKAKKDRKDIARESTLVAVETGSYSNDDYENLYLMDESIYSDTEQYLSELEE